MNKTGPIIIIEDDMDDQNILKTVFEDLAVANKIVFFENGNDAYEYLIETKDQPFIILSDIDMHKLNGFELKEKVRNNEQLSLKCIPYIFFTTAAEQEMVIDAYSKSIQGFFVKPPDYDKMRRVIYSIIEYWKECHPPNY